MIHNTCGVKDSTDATGMVEKSVKTQCRFNYSKSFQEVTLLIVWLIVIAIYTLLTLLNVICITKSNE